MNRKADAWFIVSVTKKCIGMDLSFHTKKEAEELLASDFYTDRMRKIRKVVPYFKIDGKSYLEIDGVMCRIV